MRALRPLLSIALIVTIVAAMAHTASAEGGCTLTGKLRCGASARTDGSNGDAREQGGNANDRSGGFWVAAPVPPANALDCNTIGGAAEAPVNITTAVATDVATGATFIGEFCVIIPAGAVFVPPAPPTLEEVLAAAAVPLPSIRLNPAVEGLTGLATYAWYDGAAAIGPVTVQIRGYTVSGNAAVDQVSFDMGRPDRAAQQTYTVDAAGFGTAEQPAVRHTYETKGSVVVTVETVWHGVFTISGNGLIPRTVDLGRLPLTATVVYPVAEGRSVLIR